MYIEKIKRTNNIVKSILFICLVCIIYNFYSPLTVKAGCSFYDPCACNDAGWTPTDINGDDVADGCLSFDHCWYSSNIGVTITGIGSDGTVNYRMDGRWCSGHNFEPEDGVLFEEYDVPDNDTDGWSDWSSTNDESTYRYRTRTVSTYVKKSADLKVWCTLCKDEPGGISGLTDASENTPVLKSTRTEKQEQYRVVVKVFLQKTDGTYNSTPDRYKQSGWASKNENVSLTWSRVATGTHYASNNYPNNDKSDKNFSGTTNVGTGKTKERYIRRKRYYIALNPNPQSGASTSVTNNSPSGFSLTNGVYKSGKLYVGATINLPSTEETFSMIGYTSSGSWYTGTNGGTAKTSHVQASASSYNDKNNLLVVNLYAHWCSEPGTVYLMPNSQTLGTDSCYAGYIGSQRNAYLFNNSTVTATEYNSNTTKRAFDKSSITLPNVSVTNVTITYDAPSGVTVDSSSGSTNVQFEKWTPYSNYNSGYYYKYSPLSKNDESALSGYINCAQCSGISTHGTLSGSSYTYDNRSSNWGADHKGETRSSLMVANFSGSWNLTLPNAYKTGYVFVGWYNGDSYVGMAGNTIDCSNWVREHNTGGSSGLAAGSYGTDALGNLSSIKLTPKFEPIKYKVLYDMNIPSDSDTTTSYGSLQSHSLLSNPNNLTGVHSLVSDGSNGKGSHTFGSTNPSDAHYSYIGSKTYTYDGSDWALENIPITVNDYYFTGWTYVDIAWTGYGGMKENGVTLGSSRIGNSIQETHDVYKDYSLKTLYMKSNIVQNVKNNLPDYPSYAGLYTDAYAANPSLSPITDATNSLAGDKATGRNYSSPTVYIVLRANWTNSINAISTSELKYNSNNISNETVTISNAYTKLTQYIDLLALNDSKLSSNAFGLKKNTSIVNSSDTTGVGDTSDDGSYDKNVTSDTFVVNKNVSKYYDGSSNGRKGFFSFQGWSTWKFATWRDAIDSNKEDVDNIELQNGCGKDDKSVNSQFQSGSLVMRCYNDVYRSKRVGDLFYRMAGVLYPKSYSLGYNSGYTNTNNNGNMLSYDGTGDNYNTGLSSDYWKSYRWRWQKGTSGNYSIPIKGVLDEGITLYAIWDAYPTSRIENTYCYRKDINTLTPGYLFSKVIATDYEDFWNQNAFSIGDTSSSGTNWNTVAKASSDMNNASASSCPAKDYTYTYSLSGNAAYMNGTFTATLVGYDFNRFKDAEFIDDIASVSVTYRFVDSAGNTTYKTAWVYIIDDDDTERDDPDDDPDNVRYSLTRFVSKEFYNKADFDEDGNYIMGSADESAGSLLKRSKWYMLNSYKAQLLDAFDKLETIGDARLAIDYLGMYAKYVDADGNAHAYHPQYNYDSESWEYDFEALKTQTKGIYVLKYDDILKTKQFVQDNNLDTGNYSGDTVQQYINSIFKHTAIKEIAD